MKFSVTERANGKRCPRMHRLSSKSGRHLGLIVPPVYLAVGSLIHKGSQMWLQDLSTSYEAHVWVASEKMIERAREIYRKQVGANIGKDEEDTLYESVYFATTMARNYQLRYGTPLEEGFTLVRAEQRVVVPVPGTEHPCEMCTGRMPFAGKGLILQPGPNADVVDCPECQGTGIVHHYLDGRFDGLIQDAAGRIHILEHKTYNARPSDESLRTNDQFLAYMWLALQTGIGEIAGLSYDGLWRRDKVPKNKTFEDLFIRTSVTRSRAELEEFQRMLPNELNFLYNQLKAPEDPWINRRWQGCYDCSFATKKLQSGAYRTGLCDAISRNENVQGVLNLHYTERDDDVEELLEFDDA